MLTVFIHTKKGIAQRSDTQSSLYWLRSAVFEPKSCSGFGSEFVTQVVARRTETSTPPPSSLFVTTEHFSSSCCDAGCSLYHWRGQYLVSQFKSHLFAKSFKTFRFITENNIISCQWSHTQCCSSSRTHHLFTDDSLCAKTPVFHDQKTE